MSYNNGIGFIVAGLVTGATVTTGAASAQVAIPVGTAGVRPRFIRIAATTESYVKFGVTGVVATTNDVMVQPADALLVAVPDGITTIAYIQGTAAGKVNVAPIEAS
jgi:hypothetical protein